MVERAAGMDGQWARRLTDLAERHGPTLFRIAFRVLRDRDAADDACQQAFLQACRCHEQVRDADRLKPWLTRVVINECFLRIRKRDREKQALHEQATPHFADEPALRQVELRESILQALAQLPEPVRVVVVLRLMNGWSGNEVKEHLGVSASEVSRRLHLGMEQLRPLLADLRDVVNR